MNLECRRRANNIPEHVFTAATRHASAETGVRHLRSDREAFWRLAGRQGTSRPLRVASINIYNMLQAKAPSGDTHPEEIRDGASREEPHVRESFKLRRGRTCMERSSQRAIR